jgi:YD repeat-containing protein
MTGKDKTMNFRILCAALLVLPAIAMAGVNPKNGNFFISYQDITQKTGDRELNLYRTYNAKSSETGWFGHGWGTPFETRMTVMPDGSVVVREHGTGQINRYAPRGGGNLQAGVDKIVTVASQRDQLAPEAAEALRNKLLADADFRRTKVLQYGIQTQLPMGVTVQSGACVGATVTRIDEEYRRTDCGKGIDYFDLAGRLIRQEDDGYKLTIHYAGKTPDRIEDTLGQKLFLKWTPTGHVAEARTEKASPVITYRYDEKDNLLLSNEIGGNFYRYEYDGNHNMTRIGYIDNTHMDMQYDANSSITSVADTDGTRTTYSYRYDPNNPSVHYWTTTSRTSPSGEQSSREDEFLLSTDAAGVEKVAGMSMTVGERKQDVVLDERGRVKRVQKPDGGFSEFTYHPIYNKISAVVTDEGRTDFQYNNAGDLIRAKNSQGQLIELDYDGNKHISRILETNKTERTRRELIFLYNAQNKPIRIALIGKGEISVEYDQNGEIAKVESKQGAKVALQVTHVMSTLLEVVKVGCVDLKI